VRFIVCKFLPVYRSPSAPPGHFSPIFLKSCSFNDALSPPRDLPQMYYFPSPLHLVPLACVRSQAGYNFQRTVLLKTSDSGPFPPCTFTIYDVESGRPADASFHFCFKHGADFMAAFLDLPDRPHAPAPFGSRPLFCGIYALKVLRDARPAARSLHSVDERLLSRIAHVDDHL